MKGWRILTMKAFPLFKRYIISYASLVVFPIIIFAVIISSFFYKTYAAENLSLYNELLKQQVDAFDSSIEKLALTAYNISNNYQLSQGYLSASISNQLSSWQYLKSAESANGFDAALNLIYFDKKIVFTSEGMLSNEYFSEQFQVDGISIDTIEEELKKEPLPYFRRFENVRGWHGAPRYIYVCPIPDGTEFPVGAVMFLISNSSVEKYLSQLSSTTGGASFILNKDGSVFSTADGENFPERALIDSALASDTGKIEYDGNKYQIISKKSDYTGLTFYAATKPQAFSPNFVRLIQIIAISSIIILFVSSFLIYYLMMINYKPLRILEKKVMEHSPDPQNLNTVKSIVSNITQKLDTLEDYYSSNINDRSNGMLLRLLTGEISDITLFHSEAKKCGLELEGDFFAAALLKFSTLSSADRKSLKQYISDFVVIKCYPIDILKPNSLAFLFYAQTDSYPILQSAAESLQVGIKNSVNATVTIGVGTWVKDVTEISASYLNAVASLDARFVKGIDTVIMFEEPNQQSSAVFQYPHHLVEQFKNVVLSNNATLVFECIDHIFAKIKSYSMPIVTTRSFCYNISQIAVNAFCKDRWSTDAEQKSQREISLLMEAETIDFLADNLKNIYMVYESSSAFGVAVDGTQFTRMLSFVQENYCDPDFSLQKMSDYFKMSPSYVSRYFAAQNNGIRLLEYTNNLRMEKAKKLLRETNLPIPVIAESVASLNLSGFTRKFKQSVGVPPGSYRKQSRENADSSEDIPDVEDDTTEE